MKQKCEFTGKNKFEDYDEALNRLILLKHLKPWDSVTGKRVKHRQKKPMLKRVYKCPYCHGYHLTSWEYNYLQQNESQDVKLKITKPFLLLWRTVLSLTPVYTGVSRNKRKGSGFSNFGHFPRNGHQPYKNRG